MVRKQHKERKPKYVEKTKYYSMDFLDFLLYIDNVSDRKSIYELSSITHWNVSIYIFISCHIYVQSY